jgi:hypothetical protein
MGQYSGGRTIAALMGGSGMLRSETAVSAVALLVLADWAAVAALPFGCPEFPGQKLVYVDVFDGPLGKLADLVPDQHVDRARKRDWNVWQLKPGAEALLAKCTYGKSAGRPYSWTETIRLPDSTRLCRADFRTGAGQSALTLTGFSCL